jgi:hypothetical protein
MGLRHGDVVQVRSAREILDTLDESGALDALPFMPEMVPLCGKRFTVDKRAERICVYHEPNARSRRLLDTVLLDDLRCDGAAHDTCQGDCRIFWKEAWLRRAEGVDAAAPAPDDGAQAELLARVTPAVRRAEESGNYPAGSWRCQTTELHRASTPVATKDPRVYLRELATGNVDIPRFARLFPRAVADEVKFRLGLLPEAVGRPRLKSPPPPTPPADPPPLNLQPGDWVEVKPLEEIVATLNPAGKYKGLWFDREMWPYCGKVFRVRQRVRRIVDEANGRMIEMKRDCVTLEGAVCNGEYTLGRWFCPRGMFPYWREAWLRRVERPAGADGAR